MNANPLRPIAVRTEVTGTRTWMCDISRVAVVVARLNSAKAFRGTTTVGRTVKIKDDGYFGRLRVMQEVVFEGVIAFKVGDYQLAASIDYSAPKPVIDYHVDGRAITIPEEPRCDHCGTRRRRNRTFVARNGRGHEMHLGGDCARNYWGVDVFEEVSLMAGIEQILSMSDEAFGAGYQRPLEVYYDFATAAGLCLDEVTRFGYTSRDASYDRGVPATGMVCAELVKHHDLHGPAEAIRDDLRRTYPNIDRVRALDATQALLWADNEAANNPTSSLWLNYAAARANDFVSAKQLGLLAFCLSAYVEATRPKTGDFVGTAGERVKDAVELRLVQRHATEWGYVSVFSDDLGNIYKAFGKIPHSEPGDVRSCTFFVKAHDTFRDQKQTIINRIKAL